MNRELNKLERKARFVYERSRLMAASRVLVFVLPLVLAACFVHSSSGPCLVIGGLLGLTSTFFLWRGHAYAGGAYAGLAIGSVAFVGPSMLYQSGICCSRQIEAGLCLTVGFSVGALLSYLAFRFEGQQTKFFISGATMVMLTGTLGCMALGAYALVGFLGGMSLVAVPAFAVFFRHSSVR